jgi:hypothetical protein
MSKRQEMILTGVIKRIGPVKKRTLAEGVKQVVYQTLFIEQHGAKPTDAFTKINFKNERTIKLMEFNTNDEVSIKLCIVPALTPTQHTEHNLHGVDITLIKKA